jgi:hypothetical protein
MWLCVICRHPLPRQRPPPPAPAGRFRWAPSPPAACSSPGLLLAGTGSVLLVLCAPRGPCCYTAPWLRRWWWSEMRPSGGGGFGLEPMAMRAARGPSYHPLRRLLHRTSVVCISLDGQPPADPVYIPGTKKMVLDFLSW